VNTVMYLRGNPCPVAAQLAASQEGVSSIKLARGVASVLTEVKVLHFAHAMATVWRSGGTAPQALGAGECPPLHVPASLQASAPYPLDKRLGRPRIVCEYPGCRTEVRPEVLKSEAMNVTLLCNVTPCSLGDRHQSFGITRCLHLQSRSVSQVCRNGADRYGVRGLVAGVDSRCVRPPQRRSNLLRERLGR
jgi:hypothetical protein